MSVSLYTTEFFCFVAISYSSTRLQQTMSPKLCAQSILDVSLEVLPSNCNLTSDDSNLCTLQIVNCSALIETSAWLSSCLHYRCHLELSQNSSYKHKFAILVNRNCSSQVFKKWFKFKLELLGQAPNMGKYGCFFGPCGSHNTPPQLPTEHDVFRWNVMRSKWSQNTNDTHIFHSQNNHHINFMWVCHVSLLTEILYPK